MPFNLPVSADAGGYRIARSLRFNSADSTYLTRTPITASNRDVMTFHCWVKRSKLTVDQYLFDAFQSATDRSLIRFGIDDTISLLTIIGGALVLNKNSAAVFRDVSAWMALTVQINTTTSSYRFWVGNEEITSFSTNTVPAAGTDTWFNHAVAHNLGRFGSSANYYDGYMAHVHLIDGLALDYSAFMRQDPATGIWGPKEYAGLYGTNGFKLDFADNSAVTAAALGKDRSGMSNLVTNSDNFTATPWVLDANAPVLTGGQADPFGGTGAFTMSLGGGTPVNPYLYASWTTVAGQTMTCSVYAKAGVGAALFQIMAGNNQGGFGQFNLTTGVVTSFGNSNTGSGTVASIASAGGGWWKCSVTATENGVVSDNFLIQLLSGTVGHSVTIFRANRSLGAVVPAELQYTNGAAVPDKNWTPNNFSVTAGVGNDSLVDTPTNYGAPGANGGGEVRGNYCTLNSTDVNTTTIIVLANGGLDATAQLGAWGAARGTVWVSSGKWYWECAVTTTVGAFSMVGVMGPLKVLSGATDMYPGVFTDSYGYLNVNGQKFNNAVGTAYGATYTNGDIVGVALDMDAGTITCYKNNVSQGVMFSGLIAPVAPSVGVNKNDGTITTNVNFGQRPFAFAAPAGFKALCTQNLPVPAIKRGDDYMTVNLRTGTGAAFSVTGKRFQPDLVWIKGRTGTPADHALYNVIAGAGQQLETNTVGVPSAEGTGLTAFNADGFSGGVLAQLNTIATGYIDWMWKEGVVPGVDMVFYTGTGVIRTVAHGLGVAPSMMIVKVVSGLTNHWFVYHSGIGATKFLVLSFTDAATTSALPWNNTAPTSTVFTVAADPSTNANGAGYINFLFADVPGFSKFGSYTGNGLADGPFVWTGFRPRFVLIKAVDAVARWVIKDTARSNYNLSLESLYPNFPDIEDTTFASLDIVSNGFKHRNISTGVNGSGVNYIYAAFAEHPFKYARAR